MSAKNLFIKTFWGQWPTEDYLTVMKGAVYGPVRWESKDLLHKFVDPARSDGWTYFENQGPTFDKSGMGWEVSILQKKSLKGYLITSPRCFYAWNMKKLQDLDEQGNFIPGTEKGFLFRSPGWRRDLAGTFLEGALRNWVPTGGHFGSHYD